MPHVTSQEDIAANVRAELARRRVDQSALALLLGVSRTAAGDRLRCRTRFAINELQAIAAHLDVPLEHLLAPAGDTLAQAEAVGQ